MKNKKAIYFLLPLVLIIWGIIIYRIFFDTISINNSEILSRGIPLKIVKENVDTFSIYADYGDPFLDYLWEYDESEVEQDPSEIVETIIEKPPVLVNWPSISFGGIVKNQKSNKQVVVVNIEESGHLMKIGDVVMGVTLKKVFNDSIQVVYEKEVKTISK